MVLIYSEEKSPRLEYIAGLIFENILKTGVAFTNDESEFRKSNNPKINYSQRKFDDCPGLTPHEILFGKDVVYPVFETTLYEGEPYFFATSGNSFLPFDPFAASFFLVTRLEEYLEPARTKYNCYPAEKSILTKYGLLKKPVVNIWARMLAGKIAERYPQFKIPDPVFKFISTIDVDNAWAYLNKGLIRSFGALVKDAITGRRANNVRRIHTWSHPEDDPYDNYQYIRSVFKGHEESVLIFFLLGDYRKYDKNISYRNKKFRQLISDLAATYEVGIHPSYYSGGGRGQNNPGKEIKRLEDITGEKVEKSRQHFLRLFFPGTYRGLIRHEITKDFTMGYAEQTGFRAGTCTPYFFYDLETDMKTNLKIYPFQVMDVTLKDYLGLNVAAAIDEIKLLMEEVRNVGGTFIGIWHNETLGNGGKGYREVFEFMNRTGFQWANE